MFPPLYRCYLLTFQPNSKTVKDPDIEKIKNDFLVAVLSSGLDPDINIEVNFARGTEAAQSRAQPQCFALLGRRESFIASGLPYLEPRRYGGRQSREHKLAWGTGWAQA